MTENILDMLGKVPWMAILSGLVLLLFAFFMASGPLLSRTLFAPSKKSQRFNSALHWLDHWKSKVVEQADLVEALKVAGKATNVDRDLLLHYERKFREAQDEYDAAHEDYFGVSEAEIDQ